MDEYIFETQVSPELYNDAEFDVDKFTWEMLGGRLAQKIAKILGDGDEWVGVAIRRAIQTGCYDSMGNEYISFRLHLRTADDTLESPLEI
jgi:hypothetical protein